jgi:hypothetical protein
MQSERERIVRDGGVKTERPVAKIGCSHLEWVRVRGFRIGFVMGMVSFVLCDFVNVLLLFQSFFFPTPFFFSFLFLFFFFLFFFCSLIFYGCHFVNQCCLVKDVADYNGVFVLRICTFISVGDR